MEEFIIEQRFMQQAYHKLARRLLSGGKTVDFLQQKLHQRVLDALADLQLKPKNLLEFGCGRGDLLQQLQQLYPNTSVLGVDIIREMLELCSSNLQVQLGDAEDPEFTDNFFDLIVSSGLMPMLSDPFMVAAQWLRILKPGGAICFATLGPDSFKELKQAFIVAGDTRPHVHAFYDMHDIGDVWRAAGGKDVVLHCEKQVIVYKQVQDIFQDLHYSGIVNASASRRRGLTGKRLWQNVQQMYPKDSNNNFPLTLEIITAVIKSKLVL